MAASLSNLREEFPALGRVLDQYIARLFSLPDGLGTNSWLTRLAESHCQAPRPERTAYLKEWNQIAAVMDPKSESEMSQRFLRTVPASAISWQATYDDLFFDALAELLAYGWLACRGYSNIAFVPEGDSKVPDLLASGTAAVECKHFRTSDDENESLASEQPGVRTLTDDHAAGLTRKVLSTFKTAVLPKFDSFPADNFERLLFADFSLDLALWGAAGPDFEPVTALRQVGLDHQIELVAVQEHSLGRPLTQTARVE
jgi:hypothetical protein